MKIRRKVRALKSDGQEIEQLVAGGLTGWLVRKFVSGPGSEVPSERRARMGILQAITSIVINLAVFVLKIIIGLSLGSIAVIADAFDSLSDIAASVLVLAGSVWARKPQDARHPFGYGRSECVAALATAILLIVVGAGIGREALVHLWRPHSYTVSWFVIGLIALTVPVKEWLALFARRLSRASGSPLIEAGYWHLRFDALMTGLVCFALISSRLGWVAVDGWVGLVIAGIIVWAGIALVKERIGPLLGEAPSSEEIHQIESAAFAVTGVRGVHDILVHKYGDTMLMSLHIEVDANWPVMDIHALSEEVEKAVEHLAGGKAVVHVDPVDRSHPLYQKVETALLTLVAERDDIEGFHDLRLTGTGDSLRIEVDVTASVETDAAVRKSVAEIVREYLHDHIDRRADLLVVVEGGYDGGRAGAGPVETSAR